MTGCNNNSGYLALQIVLDLLETLELRKSRGTILAEIGGVSFGHFYFGNL